MSLSFSRSMRSLQVDGFRATRVALLLAIVNIIALLVWFFLARVTLYEVGGAPSWQEEGLLGATCSKEAMPRLRQGQAATVRLEAGPNQPAQVFSAYLYRLPESGEQVLFAIQSRDLPDEARQGKITGQVEVEVEKITPAELVLRSSGRFLNSAPSATQAPANGQTTP